jgi:hypothetical protein
MEFGLLVRILPASVRNAGSTKKKTFMFYPRVMELYISSPEHMLKSIQRMGEKNIPTWLEHSRVKTKYKGHPVQRRTGVWGNES